MEEHRLLQSNHDDLTSERDELGRRVRDLQREADTRRNEKSDALMRAEIDRLRAEL